VTIESYFHGAKTAEAASLPIPSCAEFTNEWSLTFVAHMSLWQSALTQGRDMGVKHCATVKRVA